MIVCDVKLNILDDKDINFAVYNIILSKGNTEFTVDEIANSMKNYIDWTYDVTELRVKQLIRSWLKSGMIKQDINTFTRA